MAVVTMRQLLEAGVHFGHQTRRWNPKMRRFIYGERNGIYVIDLRQTVGLIEQAYTFIRDLVARGGTVLFVGTKKQAAETIRYQAERVGMPYVTERWMGGMLTNFETIKGRISRLKELEAMEQAGTYELLLTSPVRISDIVFGKFLGGLVLVLAMVLESILARRFAPKEGTEAAA